MRELVSMSAARQSEAWHHTAAILAMLANVNRNPDTTPPFKPADFHPDTQKAAAEAPPATCGIEALKAVFVDRKLSQ